MALFDTNDDLSITQEELQSSPVTQAMLAPDLDMLNAKGNPGHDGVVDSLSYGIGFTAVRCRLG